MTIRVATKNDVADIRRLVVSLAHYYLMDKQNALPDWFESTLTAIDFDRRIESPEYSTFEYELEAAIVSHIENKAGNHLYHLFVSEQQQGKRVARTLWQHAKSACISNIYTLWSSLYAIPVYKRFGFIESDVISEKDGIYFQPMTLHT